MSLILDALSRAERDKRGRDGALADRFAQAETEREPAAVLQRWGLPFALAVALLIIAALLLRDYFGSSQKSQQVLQSANPAMQAGQTPGLPPRGQPAAQSSALSAGGASGQLRAQAQADVQAKGQPGAVRPASGSTSAAVREPGADSAARGPREAQAIEALYARGGSADSDPVLAQPQSSQQTRTVTEEAVDIEQVLREVRAEAARDPLAPHPAPLLSSLSKQFRDSVPTLMYLRHDYNAQGQSAVLINGQQLREGGRSRGVEVREILPDSVILRFAGQDFRLRSLNSWVNL